MLSICRKKNILLWIRDAMLSFPIILNTKVRCPTLPNVATTGRSHKASQDLARARAPDRGSLERPRRCSGDRPNDGVSLRRRGRSPIGERSRMAPQPIEKARSRIANGAHPSPTRKSEGRLPPGGSEAYSLKLGLRPTSVPVSQSTSAPASRLSARLRPWRRPWPSPAQRDP